MASRRIQGITIEIDGNTTKLQSSLKDVDKQLRQTQTTLKDVDKLLKLDPGNTELLTQKQKNLEKAIGSTRDRLKQLKDAQSQVEEGTAQWDALQREIAATEQDLKALEKEYKDFGSVSSQQIKAVGEKMKDIGGSIKDVGDKMTQYVTLPIAAGFGAAIKVTADFDEQMQKVSAISGSTGDDFDQLSTKAREMGEKTKFSATEAAQGFEYMAMAGWKTEDMLDGIEGIMNLAAASGEDLATTSDIVTDALTAMGYSAEDAGRLADVMAAASSNANTNVRMMGETFKYAASVGGSYGYTMEDIALATGLMANSGIKASQAGTSLRSIMSRLATDAGASNKSLGALGVLTEKLGVQFYNADGSMRPFRDVINDSRKAWKNLTQEEQANYASKIAGKNAMTGWLALMNAAEEDVTKLSSAIDNSTGTAEDMANVMQDSLNGQITILISQLQELAISVGQTLVPMARQVVGFIQGIVDELNKLDPQTKDMIVKIGLVVAAIGPLLSILGGLVIGIGQFLTFAPKVTAALAAVNLSFLPIIAVIGAVIAAGVLLWKNWDKIIAFAKNLKKNVTEAWNNLKTSVINTVTNLKTNVSNKFEEIKNNVSTAVSNAKEKFTTTIENMKTTASEKVASIKQFFESGFGSIKKTIGDKIGGAWDDFRDRLNSMKEKADSIVVKLKKAFDFNWKLPKIKLPHISVDGGEPPYGLGGKGSLPKFSIDWYKKAYNDPILFNNPTIVNTPNGLKGFGDGTGGELVYGHSQLMRDIARASSGEVTINVYATPGMNINQLADKIQDRLTQLQKQKEVAYA